MCHIYKVYKCDLKNKIKTLIKLFISPTAAHSWNYITLRLAAKFEISMTLKKKKNYYYTEHRANSVIKIFLYVWKSIILA